MSSGVTGQIWSLGFSAQITPHTLLLTPFSDRIFFSHCKNGVFGGARAEPSPSIPTEGTFASAAHLMFSIPPLDKPFSKGKMHQNIY